MAAKSDWWASGQHAIFERGVRRTLPEQMRCRNSRWWPLQDLSIQTCSIVAGAWSTFAAKRRESARLLFELFQMCLLKGTQREQVVWTCPGYIFVFGGGSSFVLFQAPPCHVSCHSSQPFVASTCLKGWVVDFFTALLARRNLVAFNFRCNWPRASRGRQGVPCQSKCAAETFRWGPLQDLPIQTCSIVAGAWSTFAEKRRESARLVFLNYFRGACLDEGASKRTKKKIENANSSVERKFARAHLPTAKWKCKRP